MSDLIKREDAIKAVWGDDINPSEVGMVFEAQSHIDRDIRLIPSANRPQGEWFVYDGDDDLYIDIECSACRTGFTVDAYRRMDIGFTIEDLKYCPNCGCWMKGADE